ncbi:uncharacterized protein G2W53_039889 [Senna tora]|uniref:Uncharacterized protein n=1 Tax=Senna tora TaxID=362788 RepID=A0A834SNK1_9FABA|nr:uncharacterized protein G2W53_039889 [Senna tora]
MVDVSCQHKDELDSNVRSMVDCGEDGRRQTMDHILQLSQNHICKYCRFQRRQDFDGSGTPTAARGFQCGWPGLRPGAAAPERVQLR